MATKTKMVNGLLFVQVGGCYLDIDSLVSIFSRQQLYIDMLLTEVEQIAMNEADFSA
jgi:hypothetical protein